MVLEIFETLNELGFVVQLLVFTYALFWLYLTFRDLPLLFGVSSVAVGFLIFIHGVSVTVLVAAFVFLVMFGMQLQQMLWFGLFPLLGLHVAGDHLMTSEEMDQPRMQAKLAMLGQRAEQGVASESELEYLERHGASQQMGGGQQQQQGQFDQMRRMQAQGLL